MGRRRASAVGLALIIGFATSLFAAPAPLDPELAKQFHNAVFFKDLEKVKKLLETQPALANAEDSYRLPLQMACDAQSIEMVQLLLAHGADAKAKSSAGSGPLSNATLAGNLPIVKLLVEKGADPKKEDGVLGAAKTADVAEYLISKGLDVKAKDSRGNTALHMAAQNSNQPVMDVLLKHGADIEAVGNFDKRPIHVAAGTVFGDSLAAVQYLASKGADLKSKGFIEESALHEAAFHGQLKTAEWLIGKGLNVNQKNRNGQTPMDVAKQANDKAMMEMLKKHGAKGGKR